MDGLTQQLWAYEPSPNGTGLIGIDMPSGLTIVGELNKCANYISNARKTAEMHGLADHIESVTLGEKIALDILAQQSLIYEKCGNIQITVPLFVPREIGSAMASEVMVSRP